MIQYNDGNQQPKSSKKTALFVLALIIIGILILFTWRVISIPRMQPKLTMPLQDSIEKVLNDTLQQKAAEIPDTPVSAPTPRYFLVSYSTMRKDSPNPILGYTWLYTGGGFFRKEDIDASVYKSLEMKRECYQGIVITSIFEFKDKADYEAFSVGAHADPAPKRPKPSCGSPLFEISHPYWTTDSLQYFKLIDSGYVWPDTTGRIIHIDLGHDTAKNRRDSI